MVKLRDLEKAMRPQFIWDRAGLKLLQLNDEMEGSKDLARMIFAGISDMYGFDSHDVMTYVDMDYDSWRHKIQQFRANYKEALRRVEEGSIYLYEDPIKKFYMKLSLVLNAIKFEYDHNPYLKFDQILDNE